MKKNVIALLLAVVMASSSIGTVPVMAAEATAQEAVAIEEETVEESVEISEETVSVEASETTAEEAVTVEEETFDSDEIPAETEAAVTDEIAKDATEDKPAEGTEAVPEQDLAEVVEKSETESAKEANTAEDTEESVEIADTSAETDEDEEPVVAEVEVTEAENKEAVLADGADVVDSGTCGDNAAWTLTRTNGKLVLTISGSGDMYDYSEDFSPWASSHGEEITSAIIEDGITSIGEYAFAGCSNLISITIPDSVTIIRYIAFQGCNLKEIHINSLEAWLNIDFYDVSFSGYYDDASFSGDIYLNGTLLINAIIPDTVTKIRDFAFSGCKSLTGVTIPDSVTSIGEDAFHSCSSLTSVTIPDSVMSIGDRAFFGCSNLTSITIPNSVTSIGEHAFCRCSSLPSITIPDSVTSIANAAFARCSNLTSVTIPNSVTSIGENAFGDCYNLPSITIPDSVTSIEYFAFAGCDSLTSITIPDSVTNIGGGAFSECSNLTSITIPDSVTSIGASAFSYSYNITVFVYSGSYAEEYVQSEGVRYKIICKNHIWDTEYTVDKAATYTEEGTKSIHCSVCDAIQEGSATVIPKLPKPVSMLTILGISDKTYNGTAQTQALVVKDGTITLKEGTDYTVSYGNNINAGTATVTIAGIGNYTGSADRTFTIDKAAQSITAKSSLATVSVGKTVTVSTTGAKGTVTYSSSNAAVATVDSKTGKVTAKKVGTVTITAQSAATANYNAASEKATIKVVPAATTSLSAANLSTGIKLTWKKVAGANGYIIYRNGSKIKTITSGSTVTYSDTKANTNGTKYTYKVVAKATTGTSTLSKSLTTYRVARTAISSLASGTAGKMTVKWKKNAKANGYQVQYSKSKSFSSGNKTATITKNTLINKTIGSLTKGKKYYVRVRCFKTVSGKKYYSAWSAAKAVTVKNN